MPDVIEYIETTYYDSGDYSHSDLEYNWTRGEMTVTYYHRNGIDIETEIIYKED